MLPLSGTLPQALKAEVATLCSMCEAINTPRSLTVYLLVVNGEWEQYLDLPQDYSDSKTAGNFADDYLVSQFLRKSPNLPLDLDKRSVALDGFHKSEAACRATNFRFLKGRGVENHHPHFLAVRREVAKILGPLTQSDLDDVERNFGFGPGSNVGVKGRGMMPSDKYDNNITLTWNLIPFYKNLLGEIWWKHQKEPEVVPGNKFTTVPKDARKDRGICVEPMLNSYVQLGIGKVIRSKLKRSGVDLNSQSRNQILASEAFARNLATIDLEAASDTVSLEVVRELLPPRWFHLLSLARCRLTNVGGVNVELEKFSSMGNGYTFELESLLFWAIVCVVVPSKERDDCAVYGDDIICPQRYAAELIDTLEYFGFKVNTSKSFLAGCFFESCGTDWFLGTNVRPIYAKGEKDSIPYPLQLANKLRVYSWMRGYGLGCDDRFLPAWEGLKKLTPTPWRNCCVPPTLGDVGLITDRSEATVKRSKQCRWTEGGRVKTVRVPPQQLRKQSVGRHLIALRSIGSGTNVSIPIVVSPYQVILGDYDVGSEASWSQGFEPRKGLFGRPMTKWTYFHSWSEGLLWVTVA